MVKYYEKTCEYCGKEFLVQDPRTRFCSRECGYENRRKLKGQNIEHLRLYRIWSHMKRRCYNKNCKDYNYYGGRGIKICDYWLDDFMNFYHWADSNGYKEDLTIDRIDVNKDYCPENCRWVNRLIQNNNRNFNVLIIYNDEAHTIAEWSRITGLSYNKIWRRYKKGYSVEDIFKE